MAPTTSSTVAMVLGDAIAVALMKMRGFKLSDYAALHPGGQIGKRLVMRVVGVMLKGSDNPIINITDNMNNCILKMSEKLAGAVSVVDDNKKLIGLIADYDIRRQRENKKDVFSMSIKAVMKRKPIFIHEDEMAITALELMQKRKNL